MVYHEGTDLGHDYVLPDGHRITDATIGYAVAFSATCRLSKTEQARWYFDGFDRLSDLAENAWRKPLLDGNPGYHDTVVERCARDGHIVLLYIDAHERARRSALMAWGPPRQLLSLATNFADLSFRERQALAARMVREISAPETDHLTPVQMVAPIVAALLHGRLAADLASVRHAVPVIVILADSAAPADRATKVVRAEALQFPRSHEFCGRFRRARA